MTDTPMLISAFIIGVLVALATGDVLDERAVPPVTTYADVETGCEYLITRAGGITPRVDESSYGQQYGCKPRSMGWE